MRFGEWTPPGRKYPGTEIRDPDHTGKDNPLRLSFRIKGGVNAKWRDAELDFDFVHLEQNIFTVFAPRINEGQSSVGAGQVLISGVRFYALDTP